MMDVFCRFVMIAGLLAPAQGVLAASVSVPQATVGKDARPQRPARTEEPQQSASFDDLASRAATARDSGRLEEALGLYRDALSVKSDWAEGRWYIATLLYELDRYADARDAFSEVLSREPSHAGALGLKGLCEFQLREYERALSDLLQATTKGVSRSPEIARVVRYHAAILLTRLGEFEVAYQMLTAFAAEADETPQVIEAFGVNLLRTPVLPADVSADLRDTVLLAGRAGYAMAARRSSAARPLLDELIARHPTLPHAHYARGVFFLTEDPQRALEDFRRELEISPSHVPARLQIAFELLKRGDATQARTPAQEAVALAPDYFATRLALGQVMLEMNEIDPAIPELEAAAKLAPGSPQAQFMLGRAYARAGRTADAERARAEFTRLDHAVRATREGSQAVGGIPTQGSGIEYPR
jgi:tetratricopeptide (TPR) repeat protein